MDEERCWYCGHVVKTRGNRKFRRTEDHQLPLGRGGTNAKNNKVICCAECNGDKGCLTLDEYRLVITFRKGLLKKLRLVKFYGEQRRKNV